MFRFFKKLNQIFIQVILIVFYFSIIGLGKLIHLLTNKRQKNKETYWEKPDQKKLDIYSAY